MAEQDQGSTTLSTCASDSLSEGELPPTTSDEDSGKNVNQLGMEVDEESVNPAAAAAAAAAEATATVDPAVVAGTSTAIVDEHKSTGLGSNEEDGDEGDSDDEWEQVHRGGAKRKLQDLEIVGPSKKKKKRNRSVALKELRDEPQHSYKHTHLNASQKQLLRHFCQLISPDKEWPSFPIFKTVDFQAVVYHLLTEDPSYGKKIKLKRATKLIKRNIIIIWLSMVSKDFMEPKDVFPLLKAIPHQVVFGIQHPGSNRYVKLGLEAFMEVNTPDKPQVMAKKPKGTGPLSKTDLLLSKEDLIVNSYPNPSSDKGIDLSGFTCITKWPEESDSFIPCDASSYPLFAVDCEMVRTRDGLTLARVSIVDESLNCIYDTLVKPSQPILDYITKFSGIDATMLKDVTTTLGDVHEKLKELLPANCILIGHSLENDLIALKLVHPFVIDTALVFTPFATPMMKPSLKMITKKLLQLEIQSASGGHSSIEDASSCMQLVQRKLREGFSLILPWNDKSNDKLFHVLQSQGVSTGIVDKGSVVRLFGKSCARSVDVDSDTLAVEKTKEELALGKTQCLFVQLHDMEKYLKFAERSEKSMSDVVSTMDSQVCELVDACPMGTLVCVVCGSSNLMEVKRLQEQSGASSPQLEKEVDIARCGVVTAILKPDSET